MGCKGQAADMLDIDLAAAECCRQRHQRRDQTCVLAAEERRNHVGMGLGNDGYPIAAPKPGVQEAARQSEGVSAQHPVG
jgi:hypothetical protein